ncbi:hypothetical protein P171DRAFT_26846 [Karstenula rhodostoma CBS 690.94]|uniref:DUF7924 domain-containing protein n=1 Tax=Karstenula rhodostoma CBS 690.94 TaxID=1392251 RepID=A0A9P4PFM4_9PLEO|nr:hypothetical protein P171DRAFT_26846 [Karstenula rhodostoma CBS 690.94]
MLRLHCPKASSTKRLNLSLHRRGGDKLDLLPLFLLGNHWFSCIAAQWKATICGEGIFTAQSQGGRDGATVVNNLCRLYKEAYRREPTFTEICTFSLVTDGSRLQFYVHWRETNSNHQVIHHMEVLRIFRTGSSVAWKIPVTFSRTSANGLLGLVCSLSRQPLESSVA